MPQKKLTKASKQPQNIISNPCGAPSKKWLGKDAEVQSKDIQAINPPIRKSTPASAASHEANKLLIDHVPKVGEDNNPEVYQNNSDDNSVHTLDTIPSKTIEETVGNLSEKGMKKLIFDTRIDGDNGGNNYVLALEGLCGGSSQEAGDEEDDMSIMTREDIAREDMTREDMTTDEDEAWVCVFVERKLVGHDPVEHEPQS